MTTKGRTDFYRPPSKAEQEFMYSGKSPGMTFEAFDECVVSWARNKYGERFGKALWRNELLDLDKLDLDDDLDFFRFEEYCNWVYEAVLIDSPKWADSIVGTAKFRTMKFQIEMKGKFRERMFCFIERIVFGEARRQLQKKGAKGMHEMRHNFFVRFGAGQPEALTEREEKYRLGMPNSSGEAFPPLVNMEDKLDELEAEREWLLDMCPKDKVSSYEEGKETFLVRLIIRFLPKEYDAAVKEVRSLVRFRKAGEAGTMSSISNKEDVSRRNYSEDWLPPYDELRTELVGTWKQYEKRRKEQGKHPRAGVPAMPILDGHAQPGPDQKRCYGCGSLGHIRGDPKCTAGSKAVWKGAPEGFKRRKERAALPRGILERERVELTHPSCHATIGGVEMVFVSTRMRVGTAMRVLKGVVRKVQLWRYPIKESNWIRLKNPH